MNKGYPNTYIEGAEGTGIQRPKLFDPSLQHFSAGFRAGEPSFSDPGVGERWRQARRRAMDHAVALIAGSRFARNLVLRGSYVMKTWFGDAAREPGDMDWVVVPDTDVRGDAGNDAHPPSFLARLGEMLRGEVNDLGLKDVHSRQTLLMFEELADLIRGSIVEPGLSFVDAVLTDEIWMYSRTPGRRMVFRWVAEGLPEGSLQMDFVFGEELAQLPIETEVADNVKVLTASKELSLCWKMLWLETDDYPQGKDLYDAVLLAENVKVPPALMMQALGPPSQWQVRSGLPRGVPVAGNVEWNDFKAEYPWVPGTAEDWVARLVAATAS